MEEKYTLKEWAEIEGGHTVEPSATSFDFIKDLNESKMYRTRQQLETTEFRDVANFAFINILTLYLLYNTYETAPVAKQYAAKTNEFRGFRSYRQSGTDLYQALHSVITGNGAANPQEKFLLNNLNVDEREVSLFLQRLSSGQAVPNAQGYLMRLERQLSITESDYKSARRIVADWNNTSDMQKRLVITRLLQYYRTNAIRSELYSVLSKVAKSKNLELPGAKMAEKPSTLKKIAVGTAALTGGFMVGRALGHRIGGG